jgi:hypothetical protein
VVSRRGALPGGVHPVNTGTWAHSDIRRRVDPLGAICDLERRGADRRQPEQAEALLGAGADVIALQEVTIRTEPLWRESLAAAGFGFRRGCAGTDCRRAVEAAPRGDDRGTSPLERLEAPADLPWPERVLCCAVEASRSSTFTHPSHLRLNWRKFGRTRRWPPSSLTPRRTTRVMW